MRYEGEDAMQLKVKLDEGALIPTRAHNDDAGLDLYAKDDFTVYGFSSREHDTGVHIAIPKGCMGENRSKSGLMMRFSITTDGTIDSGYTGSIHVKLFNHSTQTFHVTRGMKIAQLVIVPIITAELVQVDELEATERGSSGFGSTGRFYREGENEIS